MMLLISLFLASAVVINADVPACNGPQVFNPSQMGPSEIWYPVNYTNSQPPIFSDNFNCEYQINVPEGWYAQVTMFLNYTGKFRSEGSTPVTVTDSLGTTEEVYSTGVQNFYFIASGGKIKLSTGMSSKVQFGFRLIWKPTSPISSTITPVHSASTMPVIIGNNNIESLRITADTQVSATISPSSVEAYKQYFRSAFFFDGPSTNSSNCFGTGLQLFNTQFVSTGTTMTIMFLAPLNGIAKIILQDYQNTKNFTQFKTVGLGVKDSLDFTMNATNEPVAVQILSMYNPTSNPNVLTKLNGTGYLDVYLGSYTKNHTNRLIGYEVQSSQENLPQLFLGTIKTYVLNNGVASLTISSNQNSDFPPTKQFWRKGIIVSGMYQMQNNYGQDLSVEIDSVKGDISSVLQFSIDSVDLQPGVVLRISGGDGNTVIYNSTNKEEIEPFKRLPGGKKFTVNYSSHGTNNLGLYMSFEVIKSSRSGLFYIVFVVIFIVNLWN